MSENEFYCDTCGKKLSLGSPEHQTHACAMPQPPAPTGAEEAANAADAAEDHYVENSEGDYRVEKIKRSAFAAGAAFERDRASKENAELKATVKMQAEAGAIRLKELHAQAAENARLRKALEFYADEGNYTYDKNGNHMSTAYENNKCGSVAREALGDK